MEHYFSEGITSDAYYAYHHSKKYVRQLSKI